MFTFLSFILLDLLVQTRSIWLVNPLLAPGLLSRTLQDPRVGPVTPSAPEWTVALDSFCTCVCTIFVFMCVCVCLGVEMGGKRVSVCVLKCVIAGHKRPLISPLRQPLAQSSSFLKCPAVFSLTHNTQANVSLPSNSSSSWIITDFILTCVFNHLILPFIWESNVQRIKSILSNMGPWWPILGSQHSGKDDVVGRPMDWRASQAVWAIRVRVCSDGNKSHQILLPSVNYGP